MSCESILPYTESDQETGCTGNSSATVICRATPVMNGTSFLFLLTTRPLHSQVGRRFPSPLAFRQTLRRIGESIAEGTPRRWSGHSERNGSAVWRLDAAVSLTTALSPNALLRCCRRQRCISVPCSNLITGMIQGRLPRAQTARSLQLSCYIACIYRTYIVRCPVLFVLAGFTPEDPTELGR
jgi:hypothetical protein